MKTAFALVALTNLLAAAVAAPNSNDAKPAVSSQEDVSVPENVVFSTSKAGAKAYCGGLTAAECSAVCAYDGWECYWCSASYCNCANNIC